MFKLMLLPKTRKGLSRHALRAHLETVHAPLCLSLPDVSGPFKRYVHHYTEETGQDPFLAKPIAHWDALTTICFEDVAGFHASIGSPGYKDHVLPDEDNFREIEGSIGVPVDEAELREAPPRESKIFYLRRNLKSGDRQDLGIEWRRRLRAILAQPGASGLGYVQNIVLAPQPAPIDFIDEVTFTEPPSAEIARLIIDAESDLFDSGATQALVTTSRIFR